MVVSLFTGVLGSIFSKLLFRGISIRRKFNRSIQFLIVGSIGLVLAISFYFFGDQAVYSGKDSINSVLFDSRPIELWQVFFRFINPLISSITGIAGGIFAPSLSAGSVIGGFMASIFDPSLKTLLGLSGMIGFLTGVTRTPITAFVLVLEMTDRHSSVFPMMLAAIFSTLGAHIVGDKSYYEMMAESIKHENAGDLK